MAVLQATIKMVSATLFPSPVNFTFVVNETIGGNHSGFNTVIVPADSGSTVFTSASASGSSGILYFYFQAATTNISPVEIAIESKTTPGFKTFASIPAGDWAYLPINASDVAGTEIVVINPDLANPATVNFFYGEKG